MPALPLALLLLATVFAAPAVAQSEPTGRVVAFVLDSRGDLAVDGWQARLISARGRSHSSPVAASPDTGTIVFDDVAPGHYELQAWHSAPLPRNSSHATATWSLPVRVHVRAEETRAAAISFLEPGEDAAGDTRGGAAERGLPCLFPMVEGSRKPLPYDLGLFVLTDDGRRYPLVQDGRGHWYVEPWRPIRLPYVIQLDDERFHPEEVVLREGGVREVEVRGTGVLNLTLRREDGSPAAIEELCLAREPEPHFGSGARSSTRDRFEHPTLTLRPEGVGEFVVEDLVPGRYAMRVRSPGVPALVVEEVEVPPGPFDVEATLLGWRRIVGRLLPNRSAPLPCRIELTTGPAPGRDGKAQILSIPATLSGEKTSQWLHVPAIADSLVVDSSTSFEFPFLAPAEYVARLSVSPWCVAHRRVVLDSPMTQVAWPVPAAHALEARVVLPPDRDPTRFGILPNFRVLTRRLVAELGDEATDALVVAAGEHWRRATAEARPAPLDANGVARLEGLPTGPLLLDLVELEPVRRLVSLGRVDVDGGTAPTFDLSSTLPRNVVLDFEGEAGEPPTRGEVVLRSLEDPEARPLRDFASDGRAVLHAVTPGLYLAIFPAGAGFAAEPVDVPATDEPLTLRAELHPGRLGIARDDGRPIESSTLYLERVEGEGPWRGPSRVMSYSGAELLVRMPRGTYALTDPTDRARGEFTWRAEPNGLVTVRLEAPSDAK